MLLSVLIACAHATDSAITIASWELLFAYPPTKYVAVVTYPA